MDFTQLADRIFVDDANRPLQVFVDAVINKREILRTLKRGGADIIYDLNKADIIVVNADSQTSDSVVQDWGSEKIILLSPWVQQSERRGKAFTANEGWGGFLATGSVEGSVASIADSNHLPTPRGTPSDLNGPQGAIAMQNQQASGGMLEPSQPTSTPPVSQPPLQPQPSLQMLNGQPITMDTVLQNYPHAQVTIPASMAAALLASYASQQQQIPIAFGQMPSQMPLQMLQGQGFPLPAFTQQSGFPSGPQANFSHNLMNMPQSMNQPGRYSNFASPGIHDQRNSSVSASYRDSSMEEDDKPVSLKRKPLVSGGYKDHGKHKHGEEDRPSKHRRISDSFEHTNPASPPPAQSAPKLFTKANGEPSHFWVPVPVRNRLKIVDAIKRNGGKLVPDIAIADYVIVGNPLDPDWMRQCVTHRKTPVKALWLYESVEENEILAFNSYLFEEFPMAKKRGRQSLAKESRWSPTRAESTDAEENSVSEDDVDEGLENLTLRNQGKGKGRAAVRKPTIRKKEKVSKYVGIDAHAKTESETKAKRKVALPNTSPVRYRDPSPPPPTHVEPRGKGNLYTKEDMDYCDEYIPILLNRNPAYNMSQIAEKLYEKMPHHPARSWLAQLNRTTWRDKIVKWRRRAEILDRKERTTSDHGQPMPLQAGPSKLPMSKATGYEESPFKDPLALLASFFADGFADNLSDIEVWSTLANQYPQMSAREWENYWTMHSEEVNSEVARLSNLHGTDEHIPKVEPA